MKKAIFYLVMFLAIQYVVSMAAILICHVAGLDAHSAAAIIGMSAAANIVIMALFAWQKWTPASRSYLRSRPWAVLAWSAVAACGAILPSIGLQDIMPEMPNLVEDELEGMLGSRWGYFALGLAAPAAEEMVFRGAILRSLLSTWGKSHWAAIAVSALLFALAHFNPAQMLHAFIIGLLLGWMYYRTRSIIPGIVYHWVNNSVAYAMANLMPNADHLTDIFGTSPLRLGLAVACSLCILLPALFQLHLNMKQAEKAV